MAKALHILIYVACFRMAFSQGSVNYILNGDFELPILPTNTYRINTGANWTMLYVELCHLNWWNGTLNQFIDMQGSNY